MHFPNQALPIQCRTADQLDESHTWFHSINEKVKESAASFAFSVSKSIRSIFGGGQ
jgi:hypothetical protein